MTTIMSADDDKPDDGTVAAAMERLVAIMAQLRDPQSGCPWDLNQSFATIAPYTIEEAYEVADAISRNDVAELREELGDLLLQVVFHAQMAAEQDAFDLTAVAESICDKLVRRHPHVFADAVVDSAEAQTAAWEQHKEAERALKENPGQSDASNSGALTGVAIALPALTRALKLQARAARVGFDWPDAASALPKIAEELAELSAEMSATTAGASSGTNQDRLEDEFGDLLFACVNVGRKLHLDPEAALRRANAKFERRFARIEARLAETGLHATAVDLDVLERLWVEAKAAE